MATFLGGLVIPAVSSAPSVGPEGALYYNTTDDNVYKSNGSAWSNVGGAASGAFTSGVTIDSASGTALRVTNTGTGDSLLIEDSTSTDTSPFVVTADGKVGIGDQYPFDKVHITGGNVLLTNGQFTVDNESGSGIIAAQSQGVSGFIPPTIRFSRVGAGYTATPDNSALGSFEWATLDTDDEYQTSALMLAESGTNTATGMNDVTIYFKTQDADGWPSDRMSVSPTAVTAFVPVFAPAATTTGASVRMPHGTAPSAPTNGDVWTTTAGMYVRVNGSTVGPLSAGGGGGTVTEVEIDFGSTPQFSKTFTVTDAGITGTDKIVATPSGNVATNRVGNDAEWDMLMLSAVAGTGNLTVTAQAFPGPVVGKRKIYYQKF